MRDRLIELLNKQVGMTLPVWMAPQTIEILADGLLANGVIVPPFKMGDEVYRIVEMSTGITSKIRAIRKEAKTTGIIQPCEPTIKRFIRGVTVTKNNIIDCCENYGKTVFLTREEAEQALKEGGGVMEKEHRKSTLMNYTKEQLVEYCMCLEHNNNVMEQNFNQQYINCMKMLDDMKLINDTYKNRRKEGAE